MNTANIPQVGDIFPDFSLPTNAGNQLSLADLQGKMSVIYFYPKDDTSGCTRESIDFTTLQPEFAALNVRILGYSKDSVKSHEKFCTKHNLTLELLSDEETVLAQACGLWKEKAMYGRKYMGVERTTYLLDARGKILHIWPKVKVPDHAAEVLEYVKGLMKLAG